jgi:catechol 2,3-dioxygenase-like lactoylglutathione lyase family enzyme
MPARGINHVDLAVRNVERSLAFYLEMLGPAGLKEYARYPTYRGTEEVVYLHFAGHGLGFRPADGGEYRHYDVGIEHLAFEVDHPAEVDDAYRRCLSAGGHDPITARVPLRRRARPLLRLLCLRSGRDPGRGLLLGGLTPHTPHDQPGMIPDRGQADW